MPIKFPQIDQSNATLISFKSEYDIGNSSTAFNIDWTNGQKQKVTMTGDATATITVSPPGACNLLLKVVQDGVGSRTLTITGVKTPEGAGTVLTTGVTGAIDIISIYFDGSAYYAQVGKNFS